VPSPDEGGGMTGQFFGAEHVLVPPKLTLVSGYNLTELTSFFGFQWRLPDPCLTL